MAKANVTAERLKEVLHYDPDTGIFVWRIMLCKRMPIGSVAGCINGDGYACIGIDKKLYTAHRLAFLYMLGEFPIAVDHLNGIRTDNRWNNLRSASYKLNNENRHCAPSSNKSSGLLGVTFEHGGVLKWRARIRVNGKKLHIGTFATKEEAHTAYVEAKRKYHGGCTI